MVIKLVKNGFIDSWQGFRNVIITTVVAFALLMVAGLTIENDNLIVFVGMLIFAMYALLIVAAVISVLAYIRLLYRSLYREESYRAFTQPVDTWQIYTSKIILAFIWAVIITVVTMASAMISVSFLLRNQGEILEVIGSFVSYFFSRVDWSIILVWTVEGIVQLIYTASIFLLIGAIVNSSKIQNRRVMWFIIIYIVSTIIMGRVFGLFESTSITANLDPNFANEIEWAAYSGYVNWANIFTITVNGQGVQTLLLVTLLKALLSGLMGFATVWLWDHKLEVID